MLPESVVLEQMKRLIEPRSIAIVGASDQISKVGGTITHNLVTSDYRGKVFLVNPKKEMIYGRRVYRSLTDIEEEVDLVEIVVPAPQVPDVLEEAGRKGVKGAVIISSGFSEVGNRELQERVYDIGRKYGMRLLGPNCFGIVNTGINLDLTFTFTHASRGDISFISQSGAMCCGALDWAALNEVGFAKFINLGNKVDVDEADVLVYLKSDEQTKVIAMYIEGFKNGRRFYEVAREVCRVKPVIALKAGVSEAGSRASRSHTGSLSGSDQVINAAFKQAGLIRVYDIESLLDSAVAFAEQPLPEGGNVAIVSNAGGLGVMTADWMSSVGFNVPVLSGEVQSRIKESVLDIGSVVNPIDMTGAADYNSYYNVIRELMEDPSIHIIVPIYVSQGLVTSDTPARAGAEILKKYRKTAPGISGLGVRV
ncbi:MAG: CoA-binding protein [Candidatus Odinarchaeota archaeon]